ncbi:MAG: WD40 repeat domain-containing protein, partial [Bacteroidales bacterium]|nr:WD40 repeat domain-containing protein [Bacteroidales bacterium]
CWSPDGKYLASGSWDKTVIIWDAKSGGCMRTLKGHSATVESVCWSSDGKYLASGSVGTIKGKYIWSYDTYYGEIIIWDTESGQRLQTLKGHSNSVESVCWSPDGKYLASGSVDKTIIIWDAESGEKLKTLEGHSDRVYSVCWSPDGKYLASGAWDNTVIIWDAKNGRSLKTLEGHSGTVYSVCWSPDGKYLASGSDDDTVKIWGVE